jgi:chorismate mutase/prephenate dehydratase
MHSSEEQLQRLREQINEVDSELIRLINRRAQLAVEVGQLKRAVGMPIYTPHREADVLRRITAQNSGPISNKSLEAIYREIMSGSFALESPQRIGYLGPIGTYSHLAASRHFGSSVDYENLHTIEGVFEEVARQHVDYGLVPIENSLGGGIADTLDAFLKFHQQVKIYGEVQLAVHFSLLADCPPHDVQRIYSRGEAFAQCRNWLATQYPLVERIPVESTAAAVRQVRADLDADPACGSAAIGSSLAGEIYGVSCLFEKIEDHVGNVTRFLILAQSETEPSGKDKSSLMFTTDDRPGALVDVLNVFKSAGINLTHIDKRPNRESNWDYTFFVDALGHRRQPAMAEAIEAARQFCKRLVVLGSYPASQRVL